MIFKQISEIRNGEKTQTRRVVQSSDTWIKKIQIGMSVFEIHGNWNTSEPRTNTETLSEGRVSVVLRNGRRLWQLGQTYAVVPKRGQFAIKDMRIRVIEIRREQVQSISHPDAMAEGVCVVDPIRPPFDYRVHGLKETFWTPEGAYRALWKSINTRKGARWEDNPDVWVLTFEVVL